MDGVLVARDKLGTVPMNTELEALLDHVLALDFKLRRALKDDC